MPVRLPVQPALVLVHRQDSRHLEVQVRASAPGLTHEGRLVLAVEVYTPDGAPLAVVGWMRGVEVRAGGAPISTGIRDGGGGVSSASLVVLAGGIPTRVSTIGGESNSNYNSKEDPRAPRHGNEWSKKA